MDQIELARNHDDVGLVGEAADEAFEGARVGDGAFEEVAAGFGADAEVRGC